MNREIKFRVYYKNILNGYERLISKDGLVYWEWMCLDLNPDNFERWTKGVYPSDFEYKRMQFTGLKDVNDKEIYEGDIFYNDDRKENSVVVFDSTRSMFISQYTKHGDTYPLHQSIENLYCCIGNIFENPDLLS